MIRTVFLVAAIVPSVSYGATIYMCKSPARIFWAQAHCSTHGGTVERTMRVSDGLSWDDQVAQAENCLALDRKVNELDAMARQPQTGQTQDWIRQERKKARDQQVGASCQ